MTGSHSRLKSAPGSRGFSSQQVCYLVTQPAAWLGFADWASSVQHHSQLPDLCHLSQMFAEKNFEIDANYGGHAKVQK